MRHFLLLCCIISLGSVLWADSWPLPRHDAGNTMLSTERIKLPLSLAWKVPGGGEPILATEDMLITKSKVAVRAFALNNGKLRWRIPGSWNDACVYGDRLILIERITEYREGMSLKTAAFSLADAHSLWTHQWDVNARSIIPTHVTAYKDSLYFANGNEGHLWQIDPQDGTIKQELTLEADSWSGGVPAFRDDRAYWGAGHHPYVIDLATFTCHTLSFYDGGNCYPLVWGDYLCLQGWNYWANIIPLSAAKAQPGFIRLYGARNGVHAIAPVDHGLLLEQDCWAEGLTAYDLVNGKPVWALKPMIVNGCSATAQSVFVTSIRDLPGRKGQVMMDGTLYALDSRTGQVRWYCRRAGRHVIGTPIIANQHVAICVDGGTYCFRAAKGASTHHASGKAART